MKVSVQCNMLRLKILDRLNIRYIPSLIFPRLILPFAFACPNLHYLRLRCFVLYDEHVTYATYDRKVDANGPTQSKQWNPLLFTSRRVSGTGSEDRNKTP